jgi:hypothetical protein
MLLTARILADVADVNHWTAADVAESVEGSTLDLYFQTVDGSVERHNVPAGRRYIPAAGALLEVTIETINTAKRVVRAATNPFPEDKSIFKLSLTPADGLVGTFSLKLKLVEGAKTSYGVLKQAISIRPQVESY